MDRLRRAMTAGPRIRQTRKAVRAARAARKVMYRKRFRGDTVSERRERK
jgi:hypothetical protein